MRIVVWQWRENILSLRPFIFLFEPKALDRRKMAPAMKQQLAKVPRAAHAPFEGLVPVTIPTVILYARER